MSRFARIMLQSAAPSLPSTVRLAQAFAREGTIRDFSRLNDGVIPVPQPRPKARRATRWCNSPLCTHCRRRDGVLLQQIERKLAATGIVALGPWQHVERRQGS